MNPIMSSQGYYLVSVIIPVFNAVSYLEEAVLSATSLSNTGEVLLIDDASTDGSLDLCRKLEKTNSKIRVLLHPDGKNHGAASSRNIGIMNARFDYVSFLDSDDYYLPTRFDIEEKVFEKFPDADGVYGCTQAIFTNELVKESFLKNYETERTTLTKRLTPDELFKILLFGGAGRFHTSGITLHKTAITKAGMFNPAIRQVEDTEFWLRLSLKTRLYPGCIDEPIAIRRVHDTNSIHQLDFVDARTRDMYQILFDWVLKQPYSFEVKNSFFITLLKYGRPANYKASKLFWEQVKRSPSILFSTFFFKKVKQVYYKK